MQSTRLKVFLLRWELSAKLIVESNPCRQEGCACHKRDGERLGELLWSRVFCLQSFVRERPRRADSPLYSCIVKRGNTSHSSGPYHIRCRDQRQGRHVELHSARGVRESTFMWNLCEIHFKSSVYCRANSAEQETFSRSHLPLKIKILALLRRLRHQTTSCQIHKTRKVRDPGSRRKNVELHQCLRRLPHELYPLSNQAAEKYGNMDAQVTGNMDV